MNPATEYRCFCCGQRCIRIFHEVEAAPVNSVLNLTTRESALSFPTRPVRLGFCEACGFIFNTVFDKSMVEYSSRCEESQGCSATFRKWQEGLARKLVERYALRNKKLIEIGCGKGEFLNLLCELGANTGIGFDPAYIPERNTSPAAARIQFIRDYYGEKYTDHRGDFVCCKMTLEHISDVGGFVRMVRRSLEGAPATKVFFQVPNAQRILNEAAFWDIYYEHCSYFTAGSLARLFERAGFAILALGCEYDDQYLTLEAAPTNGVGPQAVSTGDMDALRTAVSRFAARVQTHVAQWRERLRGYRDAGRRVVVWGSGSKGVTFLATVDVRDAVGCVVDINPNKQGCYMAKTGLEIVSPEFLRRYRPDVVIVMNPVYREEIIADLNRMALQPAVLTI
jgi:SAM-dependent methyltransferase